MRWADSHGYAMAALLVALSIMAIMLGVALPVWRQAAQREREAELVFRGEQYVQAISLFQRRTGGYPTSFEMLRDGKYIRKLYKDPITAGDFQPVYLGQVAMATPPGQALPGPAGRGAPPAGGRGPQPAAGPQLPGLGGRGVGPAPALTGRAGQGGIGAGVGGAAGAGPIIGVVSRSTETSIRQYNGRGKYNEWLFVSTAATQQPGVPGGAQGPGAGGRGADGRGRGAGPGGLQQPGPRGGPGREAFPGRQGFPGREGFGGPGGMQQPFGRPGGGFPQPGGGFPPPTFPGSGGRR